MTKPEFAFRFGPWVCWSKGRASDSDGWVAIVITYASMIGGERRNWTRFHIAWNGRQFGQSSVLDKLLRMMTEQEFGELRAGLKAVTDGERDGCKSLDWVNGQPVETSDAVA